MAERGVLATLVATLCLGGLSGPAGAKVFHTQEQALELAFPEADEVRQRTVVLSEEQAGRIEQRSRAELPSKILKLHSGWKDGELLGWAYIDVHTVRTLPEAFLVVLHPDGRVRSLRVLAFHEPLDYLPPERFVEQFEGARPGDALRVGRDVHGIVGATLSARAVAASVRRVQAFHRVLLAPEGGADESSLAAEARADGAGDG